MHKIAIPARMWYENQEQTLTFPDRWQVDNLNSPGFDKPALSAQAIADRIDHPVEGPTLTEAAQGRKQAVIVFDDMTRPTPVKDIAPHVLARLHEAGMERSQIRFLWGLGSHGTYDMTINQFHNQLYRNPASGGLGNYQDNILRPECEAAAEMAGLNFKIDVLVNRRGEITDLWNGPCRKVFEAGLKEALEHYGVPYSVDYDIAVCNTYAKANESVISLALGLRVIKRGGGTAVLMSDVPEGQVPHYVFRSWGSDYGGRQYNPRQPGFMPRFLKKLIVVSPQPDRTSLDMICHNDDAVFVKTWPEALRMLEEEYPGPARVGVLQDGTMQYMKAEGA